MPGVKSSDDICRRWVRRIGRGFHPDTRAEDYDPALADWERRDYEDDMDRLFEMPGDPYEFAVQAMEDVLPDVDEPSVPAETVITDAERIKYWKERVPAPKAERVECAYCGKLYLVPCTEIQYVECMNYEYAQKRAQRS